MSPRSVLGTTVLTAVLAVAARAMPSAAAPAGGPTLRVGDVAPLPAIESWIAGTPVELATEARLRVFALWAAWCRPCREAVPTLGQLQLANPESLVVVGLTGRAFDNELDDVTALVEELAPAYRIAWAGNAPLDAVYQEATGMPGLPLYVVIDAEGRIAWLSRRASELAEVVSLLRAGRWDLRARAAYHSSLLDHREHVRTTMDGYEQARDEGRTAAAMAALDELIACAPASPYVFARSLKLEHLLASPAQRSEALAFARDTLADSAAACNAAILAKMARLLLDADELGAEALPLAHELALQADAVDQDGNPWVATALARAQFALGRQEEAIRIQTWARDATGDERTWARMQARLEEMLERHHRAGPAAGREAHGPAETE